MLSQRTCTTVGTVSFNSEAWGADGSKRILEVGDGFENLWQEEVVVVWDARQLFDCIENHAGSGVHQWAVFARNDGLAVYPSLAVQTSI